VAVAAFLTRFSSTPPRGHRGIPFLPQRSWGTVKPRSRWACKDYVCVNDGHKRNTVSTSSAGWSHSGRTHSPEVAPTRACRRTPSSPPQARDHLGAIAIRPIGARDRAYRGLAVVARAVGGNLGRCRFIGFGCAGITEPSGEEFTVEVRWVPSTMSSTSARYRHRSRRPAIGIRWRRHPGGSPCAPPNLAMSSRSTVARRASADSTEVRRSAATYR
jgi:hypothetical protein